MGVRPAVAAAIVVLSLTACAPQDEAESVRTWVGTITTEGTVTTVVNESGSVWGGPGRLVEELSIGVETGAEEYMLDLAFVYADERLIYVSQPGVPVVRTYDLEGIYQGDLGRPGQGPGEYEQPVYAVSSEELVFVVDGGANRAFDYFVMPVSGETWVLRSGASRSLPDCIEEPANDPRGARDRPCWRAEILFDVFGRDGRYLGEVEAPAGLRPAPSNPFVRGDRVYAVLEDEAGTIMVKRYRLVLPGEE